MLDSVEQKPVTVGDWVFVKRLREDTSLPGDIVERVGRIWMCGDGGYDVAFGGVHMGGAQDDLPSWSVFIRHPSARDTHRLIPVKRIDGGFHRGPNGGRMIPPARLININATRYDKARNLCHRKWPDLWADIQENGMRHPPVVDERLVINAGLSRIYAHHMGGAEFVECYIVDVDAREL